MARYGRSARSHQDRMSRSEPLTQALLASKLQKCSSSSAYPMQPQLSANELHWLPSTAYLPSSTLALSSPSLASPAPAASPAVGDLTPVSKSSLAPSPYRGGTSSSAIKPLI